MHKNIKYKTKYKCFHSVAVSMSAVSRESTSNWLALKLYNVRHFPWYRVYICVCVCVCCSRVLESVEKNRCQLQTITDRIRLAQARVDKIKGSKKATKVKLKPKYKNKYGSVRCVIFWVCLQVFSSAKYPAPDRLQDYSSIFTGVTDPSSQSHPRHRIQNKLRPFNEKALQVRSRSGLNKVDYRESYFF